MKWILQKLDPKHEEERCGLIRDEVVLACPDSTQTREGVVCGNWCPFFEHWEANGKHHVKLNCRSHVLHILIDEVREEGERMPKDGQEM